MRLFPLLTPAGSDTQFQYNNGGLFGGVASATYNDATGAITFQPGTDSATFFQVNDEDGNTIFKVDTTNDWTYLGNLAISGAGTDSVVFNAVDNTIDSAAIVSSIMGGGQSGWPNIIGSTGLPVGTDYSPAGWAADSGYVSGAASYCSIISGYDNVCNAIGSNIVAATHAFIKYNVLGHNTILGGGYNVTDGDHNVLIGGTANTITSAASYSIVLGGTDNNITNDYSVILGGLDCDISGSYSMAFGRRAKITAGGAACFTDTTDADFTVGTANVFGTRYTSGYWLTGGNVNIGGASTADTKLQLTAPAPYITLKNTTETNDLAGRNSGFAFKGYKADSTATTLGQIDFYHSTAADDYFSKFRLYVNGNGGAAGLFEVLSATSSSIRATIPMELNSYQFYRIQNPVNSLYINCLGIPADGWTSLASSGGSTGVQITSNGFVPLFRVTNAGLSELVGATPYHTLHNSTEEDTDGGRESRLNFKGEQSGGEETTLARIQVQHDGTADDQKGEIIIYTNDGADGDTPTEAVRIGSTQALSTINRAATLGVGATTFVITGNVMTVTGDGAGNTVATITGANSGTLLTLIFVDGLVTITDDDTHAANSVDLSAAFTSADDTVLQLVYDGTSWYEVSRSVN